jgi:hypothetical protein
MTDMDAIPAEVWEQDGPQGGAVNGVPATRAAVVTVAGVTVTREAPPLTANTNYIPAVVQNTVYHVCGTAPQRRRLLISSNVDIVISTDKGTAQAGQGLRIPANTTPVEIKACDDLYASPVGVTAAGSYISAWMEVDFG